MAQGNCEPGRGDDRLGRARGKHRVRRRQRPRDCITFDLRRPRLRLRRGLPEVLERQGFGRHRLRRQRQGRLDLWVRQLRGTDSGGGSGQESNGGDASDGTSAGSDSTGSDSTGSDSTGSDEQAGDGGSGDSDSNPSNTPSEDPTPAPSAAPTPAPSQTPTAKPTEQAKPEAVKPSKTSTSSKSSKDDDESTSRKSTTRHHSSSRHDSSSSSERSGSGDRDYSTSSTSASSSSSSTATVAATTSNLAVDGASLPLAKGTYRLSAQFGATGSWSRYHTGMDFSAPTGTPVFAVVDGTVVESSAGGWAGTHVIIEAADGSHTLYAHLSAKTVTPGTKVTAGQQIGKVGETGRAFGAHLHFEYYTPGTRPGDVYSASNPAAFLKELGLTL
ncbi:hypothetical protein BW730_15220 [Tessaracoccus aquimaris]|uniref:M23ase beta-sheet core domain-containing protein n=1 Tax=Tessaracoccus aquimaris TaxID=1332264 RepID=A0A1Q2CRB6_9ACTN|nr:M23 family metallopeptidase [Tessaracoccus aquimaris]AQP48652.1 hypothetical protein BW730_15220 [Tessaracoccus aquimaris]